ncbi:MAG: lysine 2,3-aminomutase [Caldisericota bacterium]|nr:lysine 2,3-aminomutase [Caldisericota bacterium]
MSGRTYTDVALWKNVSQQEWDDWRWQVANRIQTVEDLSQVIALTEDQRSGVISALSRFRMAITPYYALLMDPVREDCPVRRQSVPTSSELDAAPSDLNDPLYEEVDSPVPGLTHRYPDRVLFLITDQCGMYCRHCTRRRLAGHTDGCRSKQELDTAIAYIRDHDEVRDVLLSGGDALLTSDDALEYVLGEVRKIAHVEVIRIGTRTPVVLPQRITPALCTMLRRYHPLWLNTQFNSPSEITPESTRAVGMLADAGIPVGNQSVLLRGVNDCPYIMKELVQQLVAIRVRPYYLYQCDLTSGISHFRTSVYRGIEIMEFLRGHTSGFAVPQFVVDAPHGGGKIPVGPNYIVSMSPDRIVLRNYEGVIVSYPEPEQTRSRCPEPCLVCDAQKAKVPPEGIAKIFTHDAYDLTPPGTLRERRRETYHKG